MYSLFCELRALGSVEEVGSKIICSRTRPFLWFAC